MMEESMKRKLFAMVLVLALAMSICAPAFAEETGAVYSLPFTGIDVSAHQGAIDWNAVKTPDWCSLPFFVTDLGKKIL